MPPMMQPSQGIRMEERAARLHTLSVNHASANQNDSTLEQEQQKTYVIDTNVLIHDPNSLLDRKSTRLNSSHQ